MKFLDLSTANEAFAPVVTSGNSRSGAEQRKHRRRPLHYSAKIIVGGEEPARTCTLSDVSQSGARLVLDKNEDLPNRFVLLLSANGCPERRCQVIWRDGMTVGVKFALN
jgi:hypothetical protein